MFTGIVREIGAVVSLVAQGDWSFSIEAPATSHDLAIGSSVACSGVCLTVISCDETAFRVQASRETLDKTCLKSWKVGTRINLERALRVGEELGGHMVSGHVDGIATLIQRRPENDSVRLTFQLPQGFADYIPPKGSICLDGVSLTINETESAVFGVNIIPHTLKATTLGTLDVGDSVNFEIDLIARYVSRMMQGQAVR